MENDGRRLREGRRRVVCVLEGSAGDVVLEPKTSAPDGRGGIEIRDGGVAVILY